MTVEPSPALWARTLAALGAAAFILCFFWGFLLRDPTLQEFHLTSLRVFLLGAGFVGQNIVTLIVGTVVSGAWGLIGGAALGFCLHHCKKR